MHMDVDLYPTVDNQGRSVLHHLGLVPCPARIVSGIVAVYRINGQHIDLLADLGRGDPVILVDGIVIEQPGDVHG
ncbi:hypothetical protein A7M48_21750 [Acinetobacter baumannii]|nr:hypothetical protein A7M48_21750 [Acinetobacter baumannii]